MNSSSFRRQAPGRTYDLLPPEPAARTTRHARAVDIADAEFFVIGAGRTQSFDARSFKDNRRRSVIDPPASTGIVASLARAGEGWLQQASPRIFLLFVFAVSLLAFSVSGGFSSLSPAETAASGSPLHFTHVTLTPRDANGMRVLLINGIVDNDSRTTQVIRPIRADLFVREQLTASVIINPPVDVIYSGQSRGFSTRVQYAGGKIPEVRLSFMP
ncbi:hypothetical protein [Rhizobium sp. Root1220]|uniref:hypothetical protein n=1 Tax=Rhizobium sp. Root1220 TaxID=1736432 RepID=UPI0006F93231|nr:hypothetical protein [Rhizobium sp. Root1220]KQV73404.1 hypothetical protein ASC90_07940 [Rhizobium sp. Root1220]